MKVFEVLIERTDEHSQEVTQERRFVTSEYGTLKSVADYYTQHCFEYELELLSVRYILTVVHNITEDK
jgi:hypothetical protein